MNVVKTFDDRLDVGTETTTQPANGVANLFSYYGIALLAGFCILVLLPVLMVLGFFAFLVPRVLGIPLWNGPQHRVSAMHSRTGKRLLLK